MADFVIIDKSERPAGYRVSPLTLALLDGETLFLSIEKGRALGGSSARTLKTRGLRLVTRALTRDGIQGMAAWAEPIADAKP